MGNKICFILLTNKFFTGLDPTQFKEKPKPSEDFEAGDNVLLKEAERFKNCERSVEPCFPSSFYNCW